MFKVAQGRKEGRKEQGSGPCNSRGRSSAAFSFPCLSLYLSHHLFSFPFAFLFFLAVSLSLFLSSLPLAIFLLLPFRDATMCVVRRGSRQGRLANNTLQFFRSPLPPASPCPSRPLPIAMPPREKGKKVPNIQGLVRKSSSMNASTSSSALNHHPPLPPLVRTSLVIRDHLRQPFV